jgi:hypothetical protein
MTAPTPPKVPIPTGLGWLLLESVIGGSSLERIAQIAAVGAGLASEEERKAWGAYRKNLRLWVKGRQPRPDSIEALRSHLAQGVRHLLSKNFPAGSEAGEAIYRRLDEAIGPFTALAAGYIAPTPNAAQQSLLDFSSNLDQFGATFAAAAEAGNLELAKGMFLRANWLDEAFWTLPEPGLEEPRRTREALCAATNWDELTRAATPPIVNATLSWLSWLDLSVFTGGRDMAGLFPLFLPLATRFTPYAIAAMQEGQTQLPFAKWSEICELPIPNLVRMVKNIAVDINRKMGGRAKPPRGRYDAPQDRNWMSEELKKFSRQPLFSITQFNGLLAVLKPDAALQPDEGGGFDIYALHLAANLFSLLTPCDGKAPTNESRRKRPGSITVHGAIPDIYERWWRRNLKDVAGNAFEHPRPEWFIRSLGGAAHQRKRSLICV